MLEEMNVHESGRGCECGKMLEGMNMHAIGSGYECARVEAGARKCLKE